MKLRTLWMVFILALVTALVAAQQSSSPQGGTGKGPKKPPPPQPAQSSGLEGFDLLGNDEGTSLPGGSRGIIIHPEVDGAVSPSPTAKPPVQQPLLLAPRLGRVYTTRPTFYWTDAPATAEFVLLRGSGQNDVLLRVPAKQDSFQVPEKGVKLKPGERYFWNLKVDEAEEEPAPDAGFVVIGGKERSALEADLKSAGGSDAYELALAKARVFAKHFIWYDAVEAYTTLIAAHPDRAELYRERGNILGQIAATRKLADQDLEKARELEAKK